eukprot:16451371-Heterocapsa_arctica.AAC.1
MRVQMPGLTVACSAAMPPPRSTGFRAQVIFSILMVDGVGLEVCALKGLAINPVEASIECEIIVGAVGGVPPLWPNCSLS